MEVNVKLTLKILSLKPGLQSSQGKTKKYITTSFCEACESTHYRAWHLWMTALLSNPTSTGFASRQMFDGVVGFMTGVWCWQFDVVTWRVNNSFLCAGPRSAIGTSRREFTRFWNWTGDDIHVICHNSQLRSIRHYIGGLLDPFIVSTWTCSPGVTIHSGASCNVMLALVRRYVHIDVDDMSMLWGQTLEFFYVIEKDITLLYCIDHRNSLFN